MSRTLKDMIRTFAADPDPDALEAAAGLPAIVEPLADGPTALVMVEFLDAVAALTDLLETESKAVIAGNLAPLESFAREKQAIADRLEGITGSARHEPVTLNATLRAMALARIERLERAVAANAAALVAMRKALLSINRTLYTAMEKAASDGLYARAGTAVRPVELSVSGLDASL